MRPEPGRMMAWIKWLMRVDKYWISDVWTLSTRWLKHNFFWQYHDSSVLHTFYKLFRWAWGKFIFGTGGTVTLIDRKHRLISWQRDPPGAYWMERKRHRRLGKRRISTCQTENILILFYHLPLVLLGELQVLCVCSLMWSTSPATSLLISPRLDWSSTWSSPMHCVSPVYYNFWTWTCRVPSMMYTAAGPG